MTTEEKYNLLLETVRIISQTTANAESLTIAQLLYNLDVVNQLTSSAIEKVEGKK